jgi:hypothetical protein
MPGIWDRIVPASTDRLNSHLLKSAIYLAVRGVFSDNQILAALNNQLTTPLSQAAQTDLLTVKANASTGSATAKLDYLERWDALNIAVENGALTNEATYRSELSI